jgi:hypothetical protein
MGLSASYPRNTRFLPPGGGLRCRFLEVAGCRNLSKNRLLLQSTVWCVAWCQRQRSTEQQIFQLLHPERQHEDGEMMGAETCATLQLPIALP